MDTNTQACAAVMQAVLANCPFDRGDGEFAEATYVTAEENYNIDDVRNNYAPSSAFDVMVMIETENSFK